MENVSVLSIVAMVVSLILCIGTPAFLCMYMKKKNQASIKSFLIGCGTFVVFALILEQLLHVVIFNAAGAALQANIVAYALYGGLAAGLFEETGRFCAMKFLMKKSLYKEEALMYGAGHGGIEAILIGATAGISNLSAAIMINNGKIAEVLEKADAATSSSLMSLTTIPSWQFLLPGIERFVTIFLHICLSYLVYTAVRYHKMQFYFLAIALHALINAVSVLAAQVVPVAAVEAGLYVCVIILIVVVRKMYANEDQIGVAERK